MNIKMNFTVVVTLLVILCSLSALGSKVDHELKGSQNAYANSNRKVDKIIVDIKGRSFQRALKKMHTLKGDIQGTLNYIVHEVYNSNVANFDLILQVLDSNYNATTNLLVYNALNYEMNKNHHNDRILRLTVMKSFNSKNYDRGIITASKLKKELHKSACNAVAEDLKSAMKTKDYKTVKTICQNVHDYYPEVFDDVIVRVLDEAFDEINTYHLVKFFMDHTHVDQSMRVYSAVLKGMKKRNSLDQSLAVTLASGIKEAMDNSTDDITREIGLHLTWELPSSTRSIASGMPVYIINENEEYLYAAMDHWNYNSENRQVFTWVRKDRVTQGLWLIERNGDAYRIKNYRSATHSEYLLRSDIPSAEDDYAFVFTWIPGGTDNEDQSKYDWVFEPSGDYLYMKNQYKQEYLYASNQIKDIDRRYAYTQKYHQKVNGSLWKLERSFI